MNILCSFEKHTSEQKIPLWNNNNRMYVVSYRQDIFIDSSMYEHMKSVAYIVFVGPAVVHWICIFCTTVCPAHCVQATAELLYIRHKLALLHNNKAAIKSGIFDLPFPIEFPQIYVPLKNIIPPRSLLLLKSTESNHKKKVIASVTCKTLKFYLDLLFLASNKMDLDFPFVWVECRFQ